MEEARGFHELARAVAEFRDRRDWKRFHNPKDLAVSVAIEAAELLELFQWKRPDEVQALLATPEGSRRLREEMADVTGVDLLGAAWQKLGDNAEKYPVERARGTAEKYDRLGH